MSVLIMTRRICSLTSTWTAKMMLDSPTDYVTIPISCDVVGCRDDDREKDDWNTSALIVCLFPDSII